MKADSMNLFTDFWFESLFKMIIDVTIKFKFFLFILQILFDSDLWNADWLLTFEMTDFNVQIFNNDINQSFAEFTKIWFLFNQRFSMIILCWSKRVINKDIERVEWTVLHMMKSMQIVERSYRLLYLYTANMTESRRTIFLLTLVYKELLEMSLSSHFSTLSLDACEFLSFHCFSVSVVQWISWSSVEIVTWSIRLLSYLD